MKDRSEIRTGKGRQCRLIVILLLAGLLLAGWLMVSPAGAEGDSGSIIWFPEEDTEEEPIPSDLIFWFTEDNESTGNTTETTQGSIIWFPEDDTDPGQDGTTSYEDPSMLGATFRREDGLFVQLLPSGATSSDYITSSGGTTYPPRLMLDDDEETSWQISLSTTAVGSITAEFYFNSPVSVDELWIKNGFWRITKGLDQYIRNCRVHTFELSYRYAGKENYEGRESYTLADDGARVDWQRVNVGRHDQVRAIRMRIMSIYAGTKFREDVAISEIMFIRRQETADPEAAGPLPEKRERYGMATGKVTLYREASKKSRKAATLATGQAVTVIDIVDNFYHVRAGDKEGYLAESGMRIIPLESEGEGILVKNGKSTGNGKVTLYTQSGKNGKKVKTWSVGKKVEIIEFQENGWVLVGADGFYGFVRGSEVEFQ